MAYPSSSAPPPTPPPTPPPPPPPTPANLLGVTEPPTLLSLSKLCDRLRPPADTPFHDVFLDKDGDGGGRFFDFERSKDRPGRAGIFLPNRAQRATPADGKVVAVASVHSSQGYLHIIFSGALRIYDFTHTQEVGGRHTGVRGSGRGVVVLGTSALPDPFVFPTHKLLSR